MNWEIWLAIGLVLLVAFALVVNDYQRWKRSREDMQDLKRAVHRLQKDGDRQP